VESYLALEEAIQHKDQVPVEKYLDSSTKVMKLLELLEADKEHKIVIISQWRELLNMVAEILHEVNHV
jgi:hypothetical protein